MTHVAIQLEQFRNLKKMPEEYTTFFNQEIVARGTNLFKIVLAPVPPAFDAITGVGLAIATITMHNRHELYNRTKAYLTSATSLLSAPYFYFLRTLNPRALYKNENVSKNRFPTQKPERIYTNTDKSSLSSEKIYPPKYVIFNTPVHTEAWAKANAHQDLEWGVKSFTEKEILSRIGFALGMPIESVIRAVANTALLIPGIIGSILLLGSNPTLNTWAINGLEAPFALIKNIYFCALQAIFPRVGMNSSSTRVYYPQNSSSFDNDGNVGSSSRNPIWQSYRQQTSQ